MAKEAKPLFKDEGQQARHERAVAAAVKADRARAAKAFALPEGTTARAGAAIKRAVRAAIAGG